MVSLPLGDKPVHCGKFNKSLGPESESSGSFGEGPLPERSIPRPPFSKIELLTTEMPYDPSVILTPCWLFCSIIFSVACNIAQST